MARNNNKIIFGGNSKKTLDKKNETDDNSSVTTTEEDFMKQVAENSKFNHDATAYTHVYNKERKKYDILIIKIDTNTDKTIVEREELRHDSEVRARMEVQKKIAEDYINQQRRK